jgi:hypothetical protein
MVAWALWPHRYMSASVISFHFDLSDQKKFADVSAHNEAEQKVRNFMDELGNTAFSDEKLSTIARESGVGIAEIKNNWKVRAIPTPLHYFHDREKSRPWEMCCWQISFEAVDPIAAERIARELLSAQIVFALTHPLFARAPCAGDCEYSGFQPGVVPSSGRDTRPPVWQFGLAGFLAGAVSFAFIRVHSRPKT